jgi:hypothetical protein
MRNESVSGQLARAGVVGIRIREEWLISSYERFKMGIPGVPSNKKALELENHAGGKGRKPIDR